MKKLFYFIKPIVPRSVQIFLRRIVVRKQRKNHKDVWPILTSSAKKPNGWSGWPDGKKFALVLTHDVEHQSGHDKCEELLKVEKNNGFISSYNFVTERYQVSTELRSSLTNNGFEVGVHGLNHDGKLFQDKKIFDERAIKINCYLQEWKAVGFRAPAMHHNLEWIKKLNLEYDLSTFDTDPFDPQSDGVGTIFPFWVDGKEGRSGYVEMPYTLVQDFTLFILMKEESPAIWIDKLNWIAENGGMALVNVHPDYINFENESNFEEFPVKYYTDLLKYVKSNYLGQYWNALPKDVSSYYKKHIREFSSGSL